MAYGAYRVQVSVIVLSTSPPGNDMVRLERRAAATSRSSTLPTISLYDPPDESLAILFSRTSVGRRQDVGAEHFGTHEVEYLDVSQGLSCQTFHRFLRFLPGINGVTFEDQNKRSPPDRR